MKIYLDVSCLNRPFDDRSQSRIQLESEALAIVFDRLDLDAWQAVSSEIALIEIEAIPDPVRRSRVRLLLPKGSDIMPLTRRVLTRGVELEALGLQLPMTYMRPRPSPPPMFSSRAMTSCFAGALDTKAILKFESRIQSTGFRRLPMRPTLDEIRREGMAALCERLGKAGMIRFMQQFDNGSGDYAKRRRDWVESTTMREIESLIRQRRAIHKQKARKEHR